VSSDDGRVDAEYQTEFFAPKHEEEGHEHE